MESQDKEKEYEHSIREIYRKEWATASPEKKTELNNRMRRWQELMKSGLTAQQAYYKAMEEELAFTVAEEPSGKQLAIPSASRLRKAPLIFLSLALVASIVYCIVITGDRNALNTELESVQSVLASTQSELSSMKQTLASTQSDLGLTKENLASTQLDLDSTEVELSSTKQKLSSTQTELGSIKQTLASTQSDLSAAEQTLASTQQQLEVAQETLGGLGITLFASKERSADVALIDNPTATNPTWSQLMTFLSQDQTEKHTYIEDVYDCSQFSRDVHNNAEARGIRAAVVQVTFRYESTRHALNAFLTTDYGLVYVDCTESPDSIARVKTGKEYRSVEIGRVTGTNVRNDDWWDALSSYHYFLQHVSPPYLQIRGRHSVTSSIRIYW